MFSDRLAPGVIELKHVPIGEIEEKESEWSKTVRKYWSPVLSILISLSAGVVVGLSARSMNESYIYGYLLAFESIICGIISLLVSNLRYKRVFRKFILYFAIVAIMSPLSCWFGFKLA